MIYIRQTYIDLSPFTSVPIIVWNQVVGRSELMWECLLNSNSTSEIEFYLNWGSKQEEELQFEFDQVELKWISLN